MTSRERIIGIIEGRKVDRVPFVVEWGPWEQTLRRWQGEGMKSENDWHSLFDFDPFHVDAGVSFGIYPPFPEEVVADEGDLMLLRDKHGVLMRINKTTTSMPQFLEYPVRDRRSWEELKWRFDPNTPGRFPPDWSKKAKELRSVEPLVTVDTYPYGFLGGARTLMGVENALVAFALDPQLIDDINRQLCTLWCALLDRIAEETRLDEIAMWEDMAGKQGSLISPQMFRRFLSPHYKRICDLASKRGISIVSVDSDGFMHELTGLFLRAGVKVIYPYEVQAGNDLPYLLQKFRHLAAMGGMDKRAMAKDRSAIDAEIGRVRSIVALGRYVPFPDHSIPADVSWQNYQYFVWRWKEMTGKRD